MAFGYCIKTIILNVFIPSFLPLVLLPSLLSLSFFPPSFFSFFSLLPPYPSFLPLNPSFHPILPHLSFFSSSFFPSSTLIPLIRSPDPHLPPIPEVSSPLIHYSIKPLSPHYITNPSLFPLGCPPGTLFPLLSPPYGNVILKYFFITIHLNMYQMKR